MASDVLVLDRNYEPIDTTSWQKAVTLLWEGKIAVEAEYDDWKVRSTSIEIQVPSVIRHLKFYRTKKKRDVKFSRENIFIRDGGKCQYCGKKLTRNTFTYDHVKPSSLGGTTDWTNIVVACMPCNQRKGGRTPEQAKMKLLALPECPTTLPAGQLLVEFQHRIPESWKAFIRDQTASVVYWHGELEKVENT